MGKQHGTLAKAGKVLSIKLRSENKPQKLRNRKEPKRFQKEDA